MSEYIDYLEKINFGKRLKNLEYKLKNKTVIVYGAGAFFQELSGKYDLSKLNIIAISDKKFNNHGDKDTFLNYPVCAPDEINSLKPNYILTGTLNSVYLIEDLEKMLDKKIKIRPLIKKPFKELVKEIWN